MNTKRLISTALILSLLLVLCGCASATAAPTETEKPAKAEATPAPTEELTDAPEPDSPDMLLDDSSLNMVECANIDELLSAIAPDTSIILTGETYDLSSAKDYGTGYGDYYYWEEVYDGFQLVIESVNNLSISAPDGKEVIISAIPRYADVISIRDSKGVSLYNLTLGHTKEPGSCVGGVIECMTSEGITVENCSLYGCGIVGINAVNCSSIFVTDSKIYDCSEAALEYDSCSNCLFDNVEIFGCNGFTALANIRSSRNIGIINSDIHDNTAPVFLYSDYSKNVYLGGLLTENNDFDGMIFASNYPVTVDGCAFKEAAGTEAYPDTMGYFYEIMQNLGAVTPELNSISKKELFAGERKENVTWIPNENEPDMSPIEPSADGMVHVKNIDELLNAIAPNTTIYLEPGDYELGKASYYGAGGSEWYSWEDVYDGVELVVRMVENLTIKGAGSDEVNILATPRYANVIYFMNCSNVSVEGFTAGHTEQQGECSGGVLYFDCCSNTSISDVKLFGCGTVGVMGGYCSGINIKNSEIYDCTNMGIILSSCSNINLDNMQVHDNYADIYCLYDCENAFITNCGAREDHPVEYRINNCSNIKIVGCVGDVTYNVGDSRNVTVDGNIY